MLDQLILVRHGKAVKRGPGVEDEGRALTDKGTLEMRQAVPPLVRLIGSRKIIIWSSPLRRAVQTASILADALGVEQVVEVPCIGDGDWPRFTRELVRVGSAEVLVVVGHQPYLSEWSKLLAGTPLPYKKGAAAGFQLRSYHPTQGDLLWFMQPQFLKLLGLTSSPPLPPA